MATYQPMEMFPTGYVSTPAQTFTHTFFVFPLLLLFLAVHLVNVGTTVGLIQQSRQKSTGMFQSEWY